MGHGIFGWDLPPGCRVSDIPGNRPEDEAWERIVDNFFDKKRFAKQKYGLRVSGKEHRAISSLFRAKKYYKVVDAVEIYIEAAIEYGMELGRKESQAIQEENKFYETNFIKDALTSANVDKAVIDRVMDILKGNYETP